MSGEPWNEADMTEREREILEACRGVCIMLTREARMRIEFDLRQPHQTAANRAWLEQEHVALLALARLLDVDSVR
jgi:hypothetical protein